MKCGRGTHDPTRGHCDGGDPAFARKATKGIPLGRLQAAEQAAQAASVQKGQNRLERLACTGPSHAFARCPTS